MNAGEFIVELLKEIGEPKLADRVELSLRGNDEAGMTLIFAGEGTPTSVNVHCSHITVETESP